MRVTARKQQRKIDYSMRVAPVIGSYLIAKRRIARIRDAEKRDEAWERQHQWGAERMRDVIEDFGGFYRKVGQIAGTAKQMMPAPYIECFSKTMDNNPPVSFREVRKTLEESLGGHLGEHFAELSRKPVATASIAQVHFGRLLDGREVAVKVQATDAAMMIGDIESMLQTTKAMRWLGLDEGLDFPTIFRAYLDVVDEEFDFTIEGAKTEEFGKLLDAAGLADRISVPQVIMSTRRVLIMRRVRGMKLLTLFNRARAQNKIPRCPTPVSKCHGAGGFGWQGVFHSMFTAWGVMMLKHGHFHTDPHPGNFMVANDGKLVLLDWGQTKRVSEVERMHMCRLSLYMANEDHVSIAREISEHGTVRLQRPTTEALSALAYAYFDTRPSPLAEMNVMDLKNSPFVQNKIVQNTQEGFFAIRSVFLLRGMLSTCGLRMSMVEAWEAIARNALVLNGEVPPSRFRLKTKLLVNRSLLGLQRRLNVGAGSRLNAVEDYMSNKEDEEDGAPNGRSLWPSSSSLF
jgi:aarF domain-containing kinase